MIELRIFNTLVRFFIMMKNSKTKYYSFSIYHFHEGIENKGLRCQIFWDFPLYSGHKNLLIRKQLFFNVCTVEPLIVATLEDPA